MSAAPEPVRPGYTVVPANRLRRVTARRMRASAQDKPHVTLHRRARVTDLLAGWRRRREQLAATERAQLTLTAVLTRILAGALAADRRLNGLVEEDEIRLYDAINIGVAVSVDDGLTVPVIHDANAKTPVQIGAELAALAETARTGRLRPEHVAGATFTLTNLGMYGVELFTPIISPPQLAILGIGATTHTVEMVDGQPAEVARLGLSLSFDHAAVDGAEAARLLASIVTALETTTDI